MKQSVVFFPEKEKAVFKVVDAAEELSAHQVLVKTDYDLISAGTELANYHDLPNTYVEKFGFPHYPGYSTSAHVVKVGSAVTRFKVGDRVVCSWSGHRSWVIKDENRRLFPVPDWIDQKSAAVAHLCSFPMLAIRKLQIQLGEACLIAGQGLLGLLAAQLARIAGAYPVIVSDCSPERRELALKLGADHALDPMEQDYIEKVRELTDGKGPETVVEVTGNINALIQVLDCVAQNGRVALLGCTRVSDQTIDVYKYIHCKGVYLIGAHTFARPANDAAHWGHSEEDDYRTFFKYLKSGRLQIDNIISEIASPVDAEAIYQKIGMQENPPIGILLDWRNIDKDIENFSDAE